MRVMTDILNLYISMLLHYFLKWPYAVKIIICVTILVLIMHMAIKTFFFIIRKIFLPLLFMMAKYIIYFLQMLALAVVKVSPKKYEKAAKIDECMNNFGIILNGWQTEINAKPPIKYNKIVITEFIILLCISVIFVIIPYYMEPVLSGNAKEICRKMNQLTYNIQENIQEYADHYYIPVVKIDPIPEPVEDAIDEPASIQIEESEKHVLYLGEDGYSGANLRSSPKKLRGNVIVAVSGDIELFYENEVVYDGEITWLKVSTETIPEAWISKKLIRTEDLDAAGIE